MDVKSIGASSAALAPSRPAVRAAPATDDKASTAAARHPTEREEPNPVSVEQSRTLRDPRTLQYQVDSETHRVITTIVDERNDTVILQIPNVEVLRIARAIDRMQGFLVEDIA